MNLPDIGWYVGRFARIFKKMTRSVWFSPRQTVFTPKRTVKSTVSRPVWWVTILCCYELDRQVHNRKIIYISAHSSTLVFPSRVPHIV